MIKEGKQELNLEKNEIRIDDLLILAVQNERQPRNSAQVRADSIDFNCDGNGTTVSVMHHRPTNSNSASSPGEGSTSSIKQDGNVHPKSK